MAYVPEIGDIVRYKGEQYRVSSFIHMKPREWDLDNPDFRVRFAAKMVRDIIVEEGGDPDAPVMYWCGRDDATMVELSGVCGAIANISDIEYVGKVSWSQEMLDDKISSANRLIGRQIG